MVSSTIAILADIKKQYREKSQQGAVATTCCCQAYSGRVASNAQNRQRCHSFHEGNKFQDALLQYVPPSPPTEIFIGFVGFQFNLLKYNAYGL